MNQYEVFRVDKVKTAGITNVQNHNQQKKEHADFLASRNDNFNKEHLHLNRHLVYSDGFRSDINKILTEHGITKTRKDAVKMLDAVVTYSPEMTKHLCCYLNQNNEAWLKVKEHQKWMEEYNSIPEDERNELINSEKAWADDYFDRALEWYQENYGYVISAEVHYTESTPHLHIDSIPLKYDAEKNSYKLSAKEVVGNSKKLSAMQTKFHEEVGQISGLDRGVERKPGESYKRRKTKNQWELEQQKKATEEAKKATKSEEERKKALKAENADICSDISDNRSLLAEIVEAVAKEDQELLKKRQLNQQETKNLQITYEEFNSAVRTFYKVALPAIQVVAERVANLLKTAIDAYKAKKLEERVAEPQKRALNAVEKGNKAISSMSGQIVFGKGGKGLDTIQMVTAELKQASATIQSSAKQMSSICDAYENAEEDDEIEFDF